MARATNDVHMLNIDSALALARVLLKDPSILILDEAT